MQTIVQEIFFTKGFYSFDFCLIVQIGGNTAFPQTAFQQNLKYGVYACRWPLVSAGPAAAFRLYSESFSGSNLHIKCFYQTKKFMWYVQEIRRPLSAIKCL